MKRFLTILVTFLTLQLIAQHFVHDFGIHAGAVSIQTDYGTRNDFLSRFGNTGTSFSFTHTLHFFNRNPRWNANHKIWSYLALRTELNVIGKTDLEHFGTFVDDNTDLGQRLRAMTGSTQVVNIGFQLEYYLKCLRDFIHPLSNIKWNPYMLAGIQYSMFDNDLNSELGDWTQNPNVLPTKWRPSSATDIGPGTTYAVTFGGGIRYNLTRKVD